MTDTTKTDKPKVTRMKRVVPVTKQFSGKEVHTTDIPVGQLEDFELPLTGSARSVIQEVDHTIDVIEGPTAEDYAAALAFNEEPVTIVVHETTDKNAIPVPGVFVNGRSQYFLRGVPVTVRRKFVEALVRTKPISVQTKVTVKSVGEEPVNEVIRTSALLYPFSVIEDKNRNGAAWLRKILAEA